MNWYYVENGQQKGPVTQDQMDELARQGTIKADSLVWTDGMANWLPYSQARPGSGAAPAAAVTGAAYASAMPAGLDADALAKKKVSGPAVGIIVCGALGRHRTGQRSGRCGRAAAKVSQMYTLPSAARAVATPKCV